MRHGRNHKKSGLSGKNTWSGIVEHYSVYKVIIKIALRLNNGSLLWLFFMLSGNLTFPLYECIQWWHGLCNGSMYPCVDCPTINRSPKLKAYMKQQLPQHSPSCTLAKCNGVCWRPHLPPVIQINDLSQVCHATIWSVLKEKHYLPKFPPSRKKGMTPDGERLHVKTRTSSIGTGAQPRFRLGALERVPGHPFRCHLCELIAAVKLGKGNPSPQNTVHVSPRPKHHVHGWRALA